MLTRSFMRSCTPLPRLAWVAAVHRSFDAVLAVSRTRCVVEGFEEPASPVIYANNATHKFDFLPFRGALFHRGLKVVSIGKAKEWHDPVQAVLLPRVGAAPLPSRGYILLVDFTATVGRRPTEEEYRALREHVDHDAPLPAGEPYATMATRPRDVLGYESVAAGADPGAYGALVRRIFAAMMADTLGMCRSAVSLGHHLHLYPEGTVTERPGRGRIGTVEFALALGLPIVPAGLSGCREAMRPRSPLTRGGEIRIRFGAPWRVPDVVPAGFEAFNPDHEAAHRPALQAATDTLVAKLDELVDPAYRHVEGQIDEGSRGTRRFL